MISQVTTSTQLDEIRTLFREYADFLKVDLCFQDFETELAELPGKYAPPSGQLLLATNHSGQALGCVALRPLGDPTESNCEMKRLYVRTEARGHQLGRQLAQQIIHEARVLGYRFMLLDTLASLTAAIQLYESLGFIHIDPYYENPLDDVVYMKLEL